MTKLDPKMKEYYQHFLHRVLQLKKQTDESSQQQQNTVVQSLAESREYLEISRQVSELSKLVRGLTTELASVKS
jgi:hypothetical protein